MRLSQFWQLMEDEFGSGYAYVMAGQLVLTKFQLTAADALAQGVQPCEIWESVLHSAGRSPGAALGTTPSAQ